MGQNVETFSFAQSRFCHAARKHGVWGKGNQFPFSDFAYLELLCLGLQWLVRWVGLRLKWFVWGPKLEYLFCNILVEGEAKELGKVVKVLNCYKPYADRKGFEDFLDDQGILKKWNLILCGDLKLTLSEKEVWGCAAKDSFLVFRSSIWIFKTCGCGTSSFGPNLEEW